MNVFRSTRGDVLPRLIDIAGHALTVAELGSFRLEDDSVPPGPQVAPLVSDELSDWAAAFTQSGVPHPPPSSSDGLPHGWTLVSILPQWTSASHLALAHRNAGGWIIVEHGDNLGLTRLYWIDATLADLYTNAVEEHKKRPSERGLDSMVDQFVRRKPRTSVRG